MYKALFQIFHIYYFHLSIQISDEQDSIIPITFQKKKKVFLEKSNNLLKANR